MKKILLLGGSGFVGRHLVEKIPHNDYEIILPLRNIQKGKKLFEKIPNIVFLDFEDKLSNIVKGSSPDIVINLLGILVEDRKNTFEKVHFFYTKELVDGAKQVGVSKFIQMSALGVDKNSKSNYRKTKLSTTQIFCYFRP